jgi:hypothetical protein
MVQPSFIHPPVMKLQARLKTSGIPEILAGWALLSRGAAEAQGAIRRRRAARRTTRRREM